MKQALLHRLEAQTQEELGAQRRVCAALVAAEQALVSGTSDEIGAALLRIGEELALWRPREERRHALVREVAREYGLAAGAVTLGGLCERLGARGARLAAMRAELLPLAREVDMRQRRMNVLARAHVAVLTEAIECCVGAGAGEASQGRLVDTRG